MRRPSPQPLHAQLRALLLERIEDGEWSPGTYLPSETQLAREYDVAVGTLRKALLSLADDGIVKRRQGKGTVVTTHESDAVLFRFLNLRRADGSRVQPASRVLDRRLRRASPSECADLALAPGAQVLHIRRVREVDDSPVIVEDITLDGARFAELAKAPEILPNTLYHLYQKVYGATVHQAQEDITAVTASPDEAATLGCAPGAPLLRVLRRATDYHGAPIERRVSMVATDRLLYRCAF